jgi:hypothetical protein
MVKSNIPSRLAVDANGIDAATTKAGGTLAVPVTSQYVAMTTGGVEALTLADGFEGQILTISLVTDGGDGTLTPSTSSGWATIVFADAGDTATLKFISNTDGWVILGLAGVAAPPVITV